MCWHPAAVGAQCPQGISHPPRHLSRQSEPPPTLLGVPGADLPARGPSGVSVATVASCIGIALGLLDDWMSGQGATAPTGLARQARIPAGHWNGERAAADLLALAAKGRSFRSLDKLFVRQGGPQVLSGSALALAAAITAWAQLTDTPSVMLIPTLIR